MIKKIAAFFAVVAAATLFAGNAQAQVATDKVVKPFTVKIGGSYFIDDIEEFGFSLGIVYDLGKTQATNPLIYSLFADFNTPYKDFGDNKVFSGGVQARYLLAPANGPGGVPYVGAGIGAYYIDVKDGGSDTKFGGKVFAGYELKSGLLGEVGFNILDNANFFDFRVGLRF